jgi:multicomponent Na+:H+ antiporter subunit C
MTLALALATAVLVGSAAYLVHKRDQLRVVARVFVISSEANLFIISEGLTRGRAPIYPLASGDAVSDPLVQALILTAIVITFGMTALLLSLLFRIYTSHHSMDQEAIAMTDVEEATERESIQERT